MTLYRKLKLLINIKLQRKPNLSKLTSNFDKGICEKYLSAIVKCFLFLFLFFVMKLFKGKSNALKDYVIINNIFQFC